MTKSERPNIMNLWGNDIGWWNISYNRSQLGYRAPNIDRIGDDEASVPVLWVEDVKAAWLC